MDPRARRYLIVGAGLAGASTAWHLRARGAAHVTLLEREPLPGLHASGRNAAMVRSALDEPVLQPLADEGAAALRSGRLAPFRRTGGLLLGRGTEDARAHVPLARGRGRHVPEDGVVDVAALLQTWLRGQDVRHGCAARDFAVRDDVVHVETDEATLEADVVVNAAGPWAGEVGRIAMTPRNRTLYVSEPDPRVDPGWPFVWDVDAGYYLRPESGGWLLCACDERPAPPGRYEEDEAVLDDLARKLARHQPGLAELRIAHRWVGQRTFAPDELPVIGPDPHRPWLFHVAGLGGHGVTLSPAVGRLAAGMLLGEAVPPAALAAARLTAPAARS